MVNTELIKGRMKKLGFKNRDLANSMGVSYATASAAINNKHQLTISEMDKIIDALEIPAAEISSYFFTNPLMEKTVEKPKEEKPAEREIVFMRQRCLDGEWIEFKRSAEEQKRILLAKKEGIMTNFEAHELERMQRNIKNDAFASGMLELAVELKVTDSEFHRACENVKELLRFASGYVTVPELVEHITGSADEI